jgi:hypothetical protein
LYVPAIFTILPPHGMCSDSRLQVAVGTILGEIANYVYVLPLAPVSTVAC